MSRPPVRLNQKRAVLPEIGRSLVEAPGVVVSAGCRTGSRRIAREGQQLALLVPAPLVLDIGAAHVVEQTVIGAGRHVMSLFGLARSRRASGIGPAHNTCGTIFRDAGGKEASFKAGL